jgi:6-phosphogluconolactonase (cycloisomerase 2 family)
VHPSGKFAYVANGNGQSISVFAIDPTSGDLIAQGEVAVQQFPNFLAFDQSGNFLYVTNNSSNTISGFAVDPITGNLAPLSGAPFTEIGGTGPIWISVDPTNQYMYVTNEGTNTIGVLTIGTDGELTLKYSVTTGTQPLSMALVK